MKNTQIGILGEVWEIKYQTKEKDKQLERLDGYCDNSVKKIVIRIFEKGQYNIEDIKQEYRATLRHEIYHAFFNESGLRFETSHTEPWSMNEEMIDWLAIQYPKIHEVFKKLNIEN